MTLALLVWVLITAGNMDNRDFYFAWNGMRIVDTCIVVQDLPAYDIASFTTGQYIGGRRPTGHKWIATHRLAPRP